MNWETILPSRFDANTVSDEIIFAVIREWRDKQLAKSDWTQLSDAPVDSAAWATYRQELRDLPSQNSDPKLIVFPEPPK